MRRRAICGEPMRRYEKPGREAVPDYLTCGRRPGHPGRHESTLYVRARASEKQAAGSRVLAAALRQARTRAGLSQYRLAAAIGVSRSAVQNWEDARRIPQEDNWIQLELTLGPLGAVRNTIPRPETREETPMQQGNPAELAGPDVDPAAGWDPLAVREMDDAVRRGDLAARMLRVSARLAAAVFNKDQDTITRITRSLTPEPLSEDVTALLVVQAALIAGAGAHATTDDLLGWVDFDEHGRPLPGEVAPVILLPGAGERHAAA